MYPLKFRYAPLANDLNFSNDLLHVFLADGREISVPLLWFSQLWNADEKERANWRLIGDGIGIHWEDLDEDISVESLLYINN